MIEIRIDIEGEYRDIDLFDDEDIRMDLSIAEIQDITKKNSAFTKDFNIPGSKNNNNIFQNFYNPNSVQFSYDVRAKFSAIILYKGYIIFEGYLRLNNSVITDTEVFYNVSFYTQVGDLAANISDKYMRDLDLSYLDFNYTDNFFENLDWTDPDIEGDGFIPSDITLWTLVNKGYSYQSTTGGTETNVVNFRATPLLEFTDYIAYSGSTYTSDNPTFTNPYNRVKWWYFTPNIQIRELYSQILEQNGYTLESNFMDTAYFKRYYLPLNYSETLFPLQAITPQFIVQQNGLLDASGYTPNFCTSELCTSTITGGGFHRAINPNPVITDNFGASTGNGYSIFLSTPGFYEFKISFQATNTGSTENSLILYTFRLEDNALSTSGWSMGGFVQVVPTGTTATTYTNYVSFDSSQEATSLTNYFAFDLASLNAWGADNYVENIRIELIASPLTPRYIDGIFSYNLEFPENEFKQIDFIQSINKLFNLVVVPTLDDKKILKVEPIIDYFGTGEVLDWTNKIDRNKPIKVLPTTTILDGTLFYNYQPEKDLGHENFRKTTNREFGSVNVSLSTDYKDRITEFKPIFSSQIDYVIDINTNDFTITSPIYYLTIQKDVDGTSTNFFNPFRKQPQLLYRGINILTSMLGLYEPSPLPFEPGRDFTAWWWESNTGFTMGIPILRTSWQENNRFITYPWGLTGFSHFTNFNKLDRFDPDEQDFSCYEDMYDVYYKDYIEDLTSEQSRVLSCSVFLEPFEIKKLNFSEKIFIDGEYYRLNKIQNYSLLKRDVVNVELIKITRDYRGHRVRYFDLIPCNSGQTELHTSTDLNATMFAYVGKYMRLLPTDSCYYVQNGTYNSSYTYTQVKSAIQTNFYDFSTVVFDDCDTCTGTTANPGFTEMIGLNVYEELDCDILQPVPYPPSATPSPTVSPTPTLTPSPTRPTCDCVEVSFYNDREREGIVEYLDCFGEYQVELIDPFSFFVNCMCNGSWIISTGINVVVLGTCPGYTPTPTASNTATPTPTPSAFSCDCREYSLTANFDGPASADYINCFGNAQSILVPRGDEATFCACEGSVDYLEGTLIDLGPCAAPSPTPTKTPTSTPTPTPSATSGPAFDPDAAYYLEQVLFAGGTGLTATISGATDTLFTQLKADGIYTKLHCLYPILGGVANSHAINGIDPSTFFIQWFGGMTHSASGVRGNGTNGYGNTNWVQSVETTASNTHISSYIVASGNTAWDMGRQTVAGHTALNSTNAGVQLRGQISRSVTQIFTATNYETGFYGLSRENASNVYYETPFNNGSAASTEGTLQNASIGLMTNLGFGTFSSKTYGAWTIGEGLTTTDLSNLATAITNFNNTIGR